MFIFFTAYWTLHNIAPCIVFYMYDCTLVTFFIKGYLTSLDFGITNVYSDSSGNMSTSDLKISLRRGDSSLEGVTAAIRSATYFWSPVSHNP